MNIFSHFIFLIISFSCPLLYTQVKIGNGSLISQVVKNERAGSISIGAIFGETCRSGKEAKATPRLQVLPQSGAKLSQVNALNLFLHNWSQKEHNQLKKQKHRVFVVPATLGSGYRLYQLAGNLNMTVASYAWITTHSITDLFHSVSSKKMSSMQDNVETKAYFPENLQEFHNFKKKFRSNFTNIHPNQEHDEAGIFASQADDPVRALFHKPNITNLLIQRIFSAADSSAELQFINWKLPSAKVVNFFNVIGKTHQSQHRIKEFGFLETTDVKALYLNSIEISKENLLPAYLWHTERRRRILTSRSEPIRVGLPSQSMFQQFVKVETDSKTNVTSCDGFSLKVFEEAMKIADVDNDLTYNYYSFMGGYEDLDKQIALTKFAAVAGDVTILEEGHEYADFTQPYTETGMKLVVAVQSRLPIQTWLFMNPFTTELCGLVLAITIYNGFIVWLIERNHNPESTLSANKLHGNLSRMVMVVGLFVALILTQSYNSILSSMLTAQRLAPVKDVATLNYADFSQPYTESLISFDFPTDSRLPIKMWHTERRRRIMTSRSEPIREGVPAHSMFQQFVKVETDPKTNVTSYDGFSLKVFEEAMKIADVNNDLTYNYFSFDGEYDDLVKQIALGKFDVVAGDVTILEERHQYADFSQAYTESGVVLVVPIQSRLPIQMWLFMNPFKTELWSLILAITIYNGFIVWLIERNHNPGFRSGTVWDQIGTLFWPASTTFFTLSADKLHSNLSRMVMVVWLFVALILTQSYTSILSSMLTAQRLAPATKDVATLKKMNATVGYCRGSFLKSYMINAMGFDSANIKKYSSTRDYAKALKTGEIAGIFLEVPSAEVFLSQYCKSFMKTEKIFKVGGYGFAFKKDFPLFPDINKAILKISENGKLQELEERYINSKECAEPVLISIEDASIGLDSFAILFVLTGCASTVALAIYVIRYIICFLYSTPECSNLFKRVSAFTKRWIKYRRPSSVIVINLENPGNPPDAPYSEVRQSVGTTIDTESLEDHPEAPGPDNKV